MSSRETGREGRLRLQALRARVKRDPDRQSVASEVADTLELRAVTPDPSEIPSLLYDRRVFQIERVKQKVEGGSATPEDLRYLYRAIQVLRENPDNRA